MSSPQHVTASPAHPSLRNPSALGHTQPLSLCPRAREGTQAGLQSHVLHKDYIPATGEEIFLWDLRHKDHEMMEHPGAKLSLCGEGLWDSEVDMEERRAERHRETQTPM